jgi:hypothetical protein
MNYRLRDPDSLKDVVAVQRGLLGARRCAEIIGKSESLINKAADIDDDMMLKAEDLIRLDVACGQDAAGHGFPFQSYVARQISKLVGGPLPQLDVASAVMRVGAVVGDLNDQVLAARAPVGEGGAELTAHEKIAIKQAVKKVQDSCSLLARTVDTVPPPTTRGTGRVR